MEYLKVYADAELMAAIKSTAAEKGISEAELCRRYLRRQLGLEAAYSNITVIQEALRGILQQELSPIRRLSFIAAFEGTTNHMWAQETLGQMLMLHKVGHDKIRAEIDDIEAAVRKLAANRTREAHPEREAEPPEPPEPLPGADEEDEEFVLDPVDAQLFQ